MTFTSAQASSKSDTIPARSFAALTHRLVRFAHITSRLYYWLRYLLALLVGSRESIKLC